MLPILEVRNISKHFGAIEALSGLSFHVNPGEILGLMGDNGAGKSTIVKIIAGNFKPNQGEILFDGKVVSFDSPLDAQRSGIEVVYQNLALCDNLSAAANVFLGREATKRIGPFRILDRVAMRNESARLFADLKSETSPSGIVKRMSGGQRQAVAIARAIRAKARLVIMDEPTAAISVRQVAEVMRLIKRLREQGVAVLLISHRMPDVFEVCERVLVLRRGLKVADKLTQHTSPEEITGLITGAIERA